MAKRKTSPFERQGYHHGNLKEALVDAARKLIAERGPFGFTLVEAARIAGVSAAAPYRHFKDRDALIAEVARRGFAAFVARMGAAAASVQSDPQESFAQMGEAYLAFAREEPGYYGAMFAGGPAAPLSPAEGAKAFGGLDEALARLSGGEAAPAARRQLAYLVWALSHGIATLSRTGLIPDDPMLRPQQLLRAGVGAWIGARPRDPAAVPARSQPAARTKRTP